MTRAERLREELDRIAAERGPEPWPPPPVPVVKGQLPLFPDQSEFDGEVRGKL